MEQLTTTQRQQLDEFLSEHDQAAFKMAYAMTGNHDDALELVQDSMMKLVQSYSDKAASEWRLLFYRILQNRIRDFHRRQGVRNLFNLFLPADKTPQDVIEQTHNASHNPEQQLHSSGMLQTITTALKVLPLRQQQTFLLRAWQEFSVQETAYALSISEGSVKTHYSRALQQLRKLLGDHHE